MKIIDRKFLNVTTHSCHAASVSIYKNKEVCSWFGGSNEGSPDVAIYIQVDNKTYTIGDEDAIPRWNPILFVYEDKLYLFVKLGLFCDRWSTLIYDISDILDKNFKIKNAKYQILPAGLNGPVKTKAIISKEPEDNGMIYCGSSVETIIDWSSYIETYKVKNGIFECFERSNPLTIPKKIYSDPYYGKRRTMGIIQPSLWYDGEKFNAFFRSSRGLGKIYYSSGIGVGCMGRYDWSDPVETKFDNPNSGIDTVYMNGRLFLIHNPSDTYRFPLVLSELDKDFNIIDELVIQEETKEKTNTQELSYPYMIENNGKLNLVYTYGRSKIETITMEV